MPTSEELNQFIQAALDRGHTEERIRSFLVENGLAEPLDPVERVTAKFRGTAALPQEEFAPARDTPLLSGGLRLAGASLKENVLGPLAGLAEQGGLAQAGTRAGIRRNFEEERLRFLEGDPGALRATIAGGLEFGSQVLPIVPGATAGRAASKALGLTGRTARIATGATAGGLEGAAVALGDRPLVEPSERKKIGLVQTLGAAGLGALGGARLPKGIADPKTRAAQAKYFRQAPAPKDRLSFSEMAAKFANDWVDDKAPVVRIGKRIGREEEFQVAAQYTRTAQSLARVNLEPLIDIRTRVSQTADRLRLPDEELKQDLYQAMVFERNLELKGRGGIEVSPESLVDSRQRLKELREKYGTPDGERIEILDDLADDLRAYSVENHLQPLRDVGVFSDVEFARILEANERFAPFERALDELAETGEDLTFGSRGAPIKGKTIKYGLLAEPGKRLEDVFSVMADRTMRIHVFTQQQRLRNMVAEAALSDPVIGKEIFPVTESVSIRLSPDEAKKLGKAEVFRRRPKFGPDTFRQYKDGQVRTFHAPKDVQQALDSMTPQEAHWVIKAMRPFTAVFRAGVTLALEFGVRNVGRDPITMGIYSKHGAIPFASNAVSFAEVIFNLRDGRALWREFAQSPAARATFLSPDRWDLAREIELGKEARRVSPLRRLGRETLANPLYPLQVVGDALEKVSRFPEFRLARRKGRSIGQSGFDGSDVTLNFPRAGRIGRQFNMMEAFANAAIQDIDKFQRSMRERPFATALKGMAYLTVPTLSMWARNKDNPDYQNLPEYEKILFLHPFQFSNGHWMRIPKPPGILNVIFSYLPQKFFDFITERDPEAGRKAVGAFVDETPLRYTPLSGIGRGQATDFMIEIMPNSIQPLIEVAANRIPFYDRPVVGESLQQFSPAGQVTEFTSSVARGIGQGSIGDFMRQAGQGELSSPVVIDHLIRGYTGSLGRIATLAVSPDQDVDILRRKIPKWARDIPILRSAVGALTSVSPVGFGSQPVREFYDLAQQVGGLASDLKVQENPSEFLRNHPEAAYAGVMRSAASQLSDLSKYRRSILQSKRMDPAVLDDELLKVDSIVTEIALMNLEFIRGAVEQDIRRALQEVQKEAGQ